MKLSERFRRVESGSINKFFAAQSVEALEAELDEANARCQQLTIDNNRLREIVGCDPQTHADRQRPITMGDLDALETRLLKALGSYPDPKEDEIVEGGRGVRSDGCVDARRFLELLDGPLTFGRMLRSIRLGDEISLEQFALSLSVSPEDLENIEEDRASISATRAVEWAKLLGYSESVFVQLSQQSPRRLVGADRDG
jgi:plasmid maintenance system antidote protein VapI